MCVRGLKEKKKKKKIRYWELLLASSVLYIYVRYIYLYLYIFIYSMYIYIYGIQNCCKLLGNRISLLLYMKSSFPKHDRRQSKNRICNTTDRFADHTFERALPS